MSQDILADDAMAFNFEFNALPLGSGTTQPNIMSIPMPMPCHAVPCKRMGLGAVIPFHLCVNSSLHLISNNYYKHDEFNIIFDVFLFSHTYVLAFGFVQYNM